MFVHVHIFFLQLVKEFAQCKSFLHNPNPAGPLTANATIAEFTIDFSETGTNARRNEEIMMAHFVRYLREVEGNTILLKNFGKKNSCQKISISINIKHVVV